MRSPAVSIIVTVFNRQRFISEAIASALAQEYRDFELIIADDASTEDIRSIVERFEDERIAYVRRAANLGVARNVRNSIAECHGRFFALLNDDDVWEPGFLQRMVDLLERTPEATVAFGDHWIIREDGTVDTAASDSNTRTWKRDLLSAGIHRPFMQQALIDQSVPCAMGALFRRSSVDWSDMPDQIGSFYDYWMGYLASRDKRAAVYDPARLTRYRVHAEMETALLGGPKKVVAARQLEFIYRALLSDARLSSIRGALARRYIRTAARLVLMELSSGRRAEAQQSARRAHATLPGPLAVALRAVCRTGPVGALIGGLVLRKR